MLERKKTAFKLVKSLDPTVSALMATCTQAALFEFDHENSKWSSQLIRGFLFVVYRRAENPAYSMMIFDRDTHEKNCQPVTRKTMFKYTYPYIFYRKNNGIHNSLNLLGIVLFFLRSNSRVLDQQKGGVSKALQGVKID